MASSSNLKDFNDQVFSISARYIDIFGKGLPGMAGTSAATQGFTNASAEIIDRLKRTVSQFNELKLKGADRESLTEPAKTIEGDLMMLNTIGAISEKLCYSLIDQLQDIIAD